MTPSRVALFCVVAFTATIYASFGGFSRPSLGNALVALFAASSLLGGISMLATLHFWTKAKPGVRVASFVLDTRPSEEPALSGWLWGRVALTSWTLAVAVAGVFCVLHALRIRV